MPTDREKAIQAHSDGWKDLYGARPRKDWSGHTTAEIETELDNIYNVPIDWAEDLEFRVKYGESEDRWAKFIAG